MVSHSCVEVKNALGLAEVDQCLVRLSIFTRWHCVLITPIQTEEQEEHNLDIARRCAAVVIAQLALARTIQNPENPQNAQGILVQRIEEDLEDGNEQIGGRSPSPARSVYTVRIISSPVCNLIEIHGSQFIRTRLKDACHFLHAQDRYSALRLASPLFLSFG